MSIRLSILQFGDPTWFSVLLFSPSSCNSLFIVYVIGYVIQESSKEHVCNLFNQANILKREEETDGWINRRQPDIRMDK